MKNYNWRFFLKTIVLLGLITQTLYASVVSEAHETGHAASVVGAGGISSPLFAPQEGSFSNSSLLSEFERKGGGINFMYGDNLHGASGLFYIPSSLGVLGISGGYAMASNILEGLEQYYYLELGYGRAFTDNFSFGLRLRPSVGTAIEGSFFGLGIDPAVLYNTHSNIEISSGLGLYDFSFYLLGRNIALNMGDGSDSAPRLSVHGGMQSGIFKYDKFSSNLLVELMGIGNFKTVPIHLGLNLQYWLFSLRAGYMISEESTLFDGFSVGAGVNYTNDLGNISFQYGVLPSTDKRASTYHFFSLTASYGQIDRKPPEVEVAYDVQDFSPNWDGKQDYINFEVDVSDDSPINAWNLTIKDSTGKAVRVFENDKRLMEKSFGIGDFFAHFFKSQESLVIPSKIRWDGTSGAVAINEVKAASQGQSNVLPDGIYTYEFITEDIKENKSAPVTGQIKIDTNVPQVLASPSTNLFSPNGDGSLDEIQILHEKSVEPDDIIEARIEDAEGNIVKKYNWQGSNIPNSLSWDGTDENNNPSSDGVYNYIITSKDSAGNSSTHEIQNITLTRALDSVDISISDKGFSPNNDGVSDIVTITPSLSSKDGLIFWEIVVTTKKVEIKGDPDSEFPKEPVKKWQGNDINSLPGEIKWAGLNNENTLAQDGLYYLTMRARYKNGNRPVSFSKEVVVDKTAPKAEVEAQLYTFSPDGDGENEEQTFNLYVKDDIYNERTEGKNKVKNCAVSIYEISYDDKEQKVRIPFKTFKMETEIPEKIIWDGKSDAGHLVESATIYEYEINAEDIYGNKTLSSIGKFETDILVLVTERGLKVRLSNVEFEFGKADLKEKSKDLLDRLATILDRYPKYKIRVEGHSDDIGKEEYNLSLSEKRAKSVMDYLIEEGIDTERISYQGLGETSPLLPNTSWYNRSRNRRVEFILLKE
ncbi:MAG: OmpA family protein [Spirochaetia bacterium]|nr:OmpA family protein [Spirochaetia bacterium]